MIYTNSVNFNFRFEIICNESTSSTYCPDILYESKFENLMAFTCAKIIIIRLQQFSHQGPVVQN